MKPHHLLACILLLCSCSRALRFVVHDEVVNRVDDRLFGQFLERASFGEPGPETFADAGGRLPEEARARLRAMRIPVIRFPGGTDVDFIDWRDMVDGVPGRAGERPVTRRDDKEITNRFGYDEYFTLRDELGCETIVVLNLFDALLKKRDLATAVRDAVGLVAYCNSPVGTQLPPGMPDWPAVRAANGHPEPFRCEYVQLGNEWVFKHDDVVETTGLTGKDELAAWYLEVLHRYVELIRAVDPAVKILADAKIGGGLEPLVLADPVLRREIAGLSLHRYAPGKVAGHFRCEGEAVDGAAMTDADWWYACATMPSLMAGDGTTVAFRSKAWDRVRRLGYPVVCTEWNWNGWSWGDASATFRETGMPMAQATGAAGFLHGLMRQGDDVWLGTQSMLLGSRWQIAAIAGDPAGKRPFVHNPQGMATTLYNLHHGDRRLRVDHAPLPTRPQPWIIGRWTRWPAKVPVVAPVDLLATADDDRVHLHVIQRHHADAFPLEFDLRALGIDRADATRHFLVDGGKAGFAIDAENLAVEGGVLRWDAPPRSVSVIEVPRP